MQKHLVRLVCLSLILALGLAGFAQAAKKKPVVQEEEVQGPGVVPEEAKRYLGQGKAIAKRAKSPQDYEEAIRLFEKAASLAPTWPEIYDDLAYAQESAEKYPEAIKSLRKYLTLAPSYLDVKNYEVRIYELEEKMKYMAGPGGDERLAQQLVGTWSQVKESKYPNMPEMSWEFEANGTKVQGNYFMDTPDKPRPYMRLDAEVRKGRLMGTYYICGKPWEGIIDGDPEPLNYGINLSPDGGSLTIDDSGGHLVNYHKK